MHKHFLTTLILSATPCAVSAVTLVNQGFAPGPFALDVSADYGLDPGSIFGTGFNIDVPAPEGWGYSNVGFIIHQFDQIYEGVEYHVGYGFWPVDPAQPTSIFQTFTTDEPGTYELMFSWYLDPENDLTKRDLSVSVGGETFSDFQIGELGEWVDQYFYFESDGGEETLTFEWQGDASVINTGDFERSNIFGIEVVLVPEPSSALLGLLSAVFLIRRKRRA